VSLFVVVVLYKRMAGESQTCISLANQIEITHVDRVLLYDNSPVANSGPIPPGWTYFHDPDNGGLARAYNHALAEAKSKGCRWMLLLDQDSELPADFLHAVQKGMRAMEPRTDVVALVPVVRLGARRLSPVIPMLGRERPYHKCNVIESRWLMAINSGTCVRVGFIEEIGGFCSDFWLDYLDHWLFRKIAQCNKSIYITDAVIEHALSVADMNSGMSVERYQNILAAERRFTNRYLPRVWQMMLVPRLVGRALKHLVFTKDKRLGCSMAAAAWAQLGSCCHGLLSRHDPH